MSTLQRTAWSPYLVGAGIGVLIWFAFASAKRPIGITTAVESTAVGLGQKIAPGASGANAFAAQADKPPRLDWEWTLAAGVVAGAMLSAMASGDRDHGTVPLRWAGTFGPSPAVRQSGAFLGGALMMFGARMAKGCTSGHGISGNLQLSASSWVFTPVMATTAGLVAHALHRQDDT